MELKNEQFNKEITIINKNITRAVKTFIALMAIFGILSFNSAYHSYLLVFVLKFITKDPDIINLILNNFELIFSLIFILAFATIIYLLNKKDKVKKKYGVKGGDETDTNIINQLKTFVKK